MAQTWEVKMGLNKNFCPICGVCFDNDYSRHRCSEKALRAIDRRKEIDERVPEFNRKPIEPSYTEQLEFGFEIIQDYD
jgi:hypothetical protein